MTVSSLPLPLPRKPRPAASKPASPSKRAYIRNFALAEGYAMNCRVAARDALRTLQSIRAAARNKAPVPSSQLWRLAEFIVTIHQDATMVISISEQMLSGKVPQGAPDAA